MSKQLPDPVQGKLTEAEAEAVAILYAERERVKVAQAERLAQMPKVGDLAEILGTTPADVQSILETIRKEGHLPSPEEEVSEPISEQLSVSYPKNVWLHVAYITLVVLALVFALAKQNTPPPGVVGRNWVGGNRQYMLQYDPLVNGYMREYNNIPAFRDHFVVDREVVAPPPGIRLTLIGSLGRMICVGPPGAANVAKESMDKLKESIRSLLRYEENRQQVGQRIKVGDYEKVPLEPNGNSSMTPEVSRYLGWHLVEVSNGRNATNAYLPDRRFADDLNAYEKEMARRLEWLADKKFVARTPPGLLIPNSHLVKLKSRIPSGTSLLMFDGKATIWADGGEFKPDRTIDAKRGGAMVVAATRELVKLALDRRAFKAPGPGKIWRVYVKVVLPGLERNSTVSLRAGEDGAVELYMPGTELDFDYLSGQCGRALESANWTMAQLMDKRIYVLQ